MLLQFQNYNTVFPIKYTFGLFFMVSIDFLDKDFNKLNIDPGYNYKIERRRTLLHAIPHDAV